MNPKITSLAALLGVAALSLTSSPALAGKLLFADNPIEGRYIVVLKDDAARLADEGRSYKPDVADVALDLSRTYRLDLEHSYTHVLRGFVATASDRALQELLLDDRIAYVEEDGVVRISQAVQQNPPWGLDRIDQRYLPLDGMYVYDTMASNVNVYVIDTGIRANHVEFGGRVQSGYSTVDDGNGSDDCNGHGTHVAGIAGAVTYGVAKAVRLYPVRVLNCNGSGSNSGVIAGQDWVAAQHLKPAVANLSLGGGASTAADQAVERLRNAGVTVVVAAGNSNGNACNFSPARSGAAITVGSSTRTDERAASSNWGPCVDIFAPGVGIPSVWHTSSTATNTISGTSMAAPHVAGVAALYLADHPHATPAQVEMAIYNNATPNVITSPGSGSANRLVYSRFGGGDPDPRPDELQNGVPISGLSGAAGSERRFTAQVPAGARNLRISINGGRGDVDLYVRFGQLPTSSAYDCRPYLNGNDETCFFPNPQAGTYHVMLRGYSSYSSVTLLASWEVDGGAPCTDCARYTGFLSGSGHAQVQPDGGYYQSGAGSQRGWLRGPDNADFDLELYRWSGSSWTRVGRSAGPDSNEHISYNGTAGYYYWRIVSYSGSGSYEFWLQRP